jgi:hypothetical protein
VIVLWTDILQYLAVTVHLMLTFGVQLPSLKDRWVGSLTERALLRSVQGRLEISMLGIVHLVRGVM